MDPQTVTKCALDDEIDAYQIKMVRMRDYRGILIINFLFFTIAVPVIILLINIHHTLMALIAFLALLLIGIISLYAQARRYSRVLNEYNSLIKKTIPEIKGEKGGANGQ